MKSFIIALLICFSTVVQAQVMEITDETAEVTFETKRNIGKLEGTIKGITGTAVLDSTNLSASYLFFSMASATMLHNDRFTGPDLTRDDCFDVKNYPTISLKSTSISKMPGASGYQFNGVLTVKNVTKNISFPFTAVPNVGGYDFTFQFPLVKKIYNLDCGFKKKLTFKVKCYAKRKIV